MARSKDKDGVEFWRGKHREAIKEIRQLKKQLRYYQKLEYNSQDEEIATDSEDTYPKKLQKKYCQECGKGELKTFEIIGRVYEHCSVCDFRKKL